MVMRPVDPEDLEPDSKLLLRLRPQLDHASWHGNRPKSWLVGVTALDELARTEDVRRMLGLPVERSLALGRNEIRLVTE